VGTLLMGALTIIRAAVAKNLARDMKGYVAAATLLGAFISVSGLILAQTFSYLPGPSIILFGVGLFFISLILRRHGG
jgi:ABC-type Mn2+/Zn2+ transport system permease subunit